MKTTSLFVFSVLALICGTTSANLISGIPQSSFSGNPNTKYEAFNETTDYSNAILDSGASKADSWVIIGTNHGYTFGQTGAIFTSPVPNTEGDFFPIISLIKGNQYWSFASYGELLSGSGQIPGGTGAKLLLETGSSSTHFAPVEVDIPSPGALMVGFNPIMSGQTPGVDYKVLKFFGKTGNLLGEVDDQAVNISGWAGDFVGVQGSEAIYSFTFDYSANNNAGNPGIANLQFVPFASAPEPSELYLLSVAVLCFAGYYFGRKVLFHD